VSEAEIFPAGSSGQITKGTSAMPKAVLKNGVISPVEPLPPEWADGQELRVEAAADEDEDEDLEAWYNEFQALVALDDPNDGARVEQTIRS
jgi:hypothetical protein